MINSISKFSTFGNLYVIWEFLHYHKIAYGYSLFIYNAGSLRSVYTHYLINKI